MQNANAEDILEINDENEHKLLRPLYDAIEKKDKTEVELLLQQGAKLNTVHYFNFVTPLAAAVKIPNNTEIIRILLDKGANIESGYPILHLACEIKENPENIRILIEHGANVNQIEDLLHSTPLHTATLIEDNLETIQLLIENGADINAKNANGSTPLHLVTESTLTCNTEIIQFFLKNGADVNATDKNNETPLHLLTRHQNFEVLKMMLDHVGNIKSENHSTILNSACKKKNNIENIGFLINYGAKINEPGRDGRTPLHNAVKAKSDLETVKLLVEKGANINAQDENDLTPLFLAVQIKLNTGIVTYLVENGADVNTKDKSNRTPFLCAACFQNLETLKLMFDFGAKIKLGVHSSILNSACKNNNNVENIRFLIDHGANVNEPDANGKTPLHNAILAYGNLETVKLLAECGADLNAKDKNDFTPLFLAVDNGEKIEIINFLLEQGAELNARDKNNDTPFCWAIRNRNFEIVKLLLEYGADPICSPQVLNSMNYTLRNYEHRHRFDKLVMLHMIQLKMLKLISDVQFEKYKVLRIQRHSKIKKFAQDCELEANKLTNELICSDRNITFADLLKQNLRKVAIYLNVDDIKSRVSETNLDRNFPIYSKLLKEKLEKARLLADFLSKGYQSLKFILDDERLPYSFLNQIIDYLGRNDIDILITVFQDATCSL